MNLIERENRAFLHTYKRLSIEIDHAKGARIWDISGNEYLDFLGGIAVNALGHGDEDILKAMIEQAKTYMHVSNYFYQEAQINLAEEIIKISGLNKIFFCNSGTEAADGTIKLIRKWGNSKGKTKIIAFKGGFHGRTYGALSMMDKPLYKDGMGPYLDGFSILPYNDLTALENEVSDGTAAIVLELLQGEGGIVQADALFVNKILELKEKFGLLLVIDEVQAGIGRTGKYFSYQHYGFTPDIAFVAKGMGGGLPLGAIITAEHLNDVWSAGNHGTTYGGNAVACATGSVVINKLKNGLLSQIEDIGFYFTHKLNQICGKFPNKVIEVRGLGLMKGLLLSFDASILVLKLIENGVITNAASGTVLRMVPPLIVTKDDIDEFIIRLEKSLSELDFSSD